MTKAHMKLDCAAAGLTEAIGMIRVCGMTDFDSLHLLVLSFLCS